MLCVATLNFRHCQPADGDSKPLPWHLKSFPAAIVAFGSQRMLEEAIALSQQLNGTIEFLVTFNVGVVSSMA